MNAYQGMQIVVDIPLFQVACLILGSELRFHGHANGFAVPRMEELGQAIRPLPVCFLYSVPTQPDAKLHGVRFGSSCWRHGVDDGWHRWLQESLRPHVNVAKLPGVRLGCAHVALVPACRRSNGRGQSLDSNGFDPPAPKHAVTGGVMMSPSGGSVRWSWLAEAAAQLSRYNRGRAPFLKATLRC